MKLKKYKKHLNKINYKKKWQKHKKITKTEMLIKIENIKLFLIIPFKYKTQKHTVFYIK